jgi:hypothetical protein
VQANDTWLSDTLPEWKAPGGAAVTRPWTNGFSAPRLLGGIATHNITTNMYTPELDFEIVSRSKVDGKTLVYNWTRVDLTLDGFVRAAKTKDILIVLDNVPFAFVRPENRYYLGFGMGAAPDDVDEFAGFVGTLAEHLADRYTLAAVSRWRFRLGTECDGPRMGPSWLNLTAPNPPFVMPDGNGGNFTTRINGLDVYTATYIAVAKALKAVIPLAKFGSVGHSANRVGFHSASRKRSRAPSPSGSGVSTAHASEKVSPCSCATEHRDSAQAIRPPSPSPTSSLP